MRKNESFINYKLMSYKEITYGVSIYTPSVSEWFMFRRTKVFIKDLYFTFSIYVIMANCRFQKY